MTTAGSFTDLVIQFGDIRGITSLPDDQGEVEITIANLGVERVEGRFGVNLYASTNSVLELPLSFGTQQGRDELLGFIQPDISLGSGESETITLNFASSRLSVPSVVAPGSYHLIAQVDPANTVVESNEENNLASTQVSAEGSDVIINWNAVALNLAADTERLFPPVLARNLAIMHAAVYDAVNAIDRSYIPYLIEVDPLEAQGASPEAAAAAAAHRVLLDLYPQQAGELNQQLSKSLAGIADGLAEDKGVVLGQFVAEKLLAARSEDGSSNSQQDYIPGDRPGEWRPTFPNYLPARFTNWGEVTPFVIPSVLDYRTDAPPDLTSELYAQDLNEVKSVGSLNSLTRTPEQTEIAKFWSFDRTYSFSIQGFWNKIGEEIALKEGNTLVENARFFALLNLAQADAGITVIDSKYFHNFWRPITAIREADTDDNPDTVAEPDWVSLINLSSTPEYIGGHSIVAGAAVAVLEDFFGEDYSFDTTSPEIPGVVRSYDSFSEAGVEASLSRIYAGLHYRFTHEVSFGLGETLGADVAQTALLPMDSLNTLNATSII